MKNCLVILLVIPGCDKINQSQQMDLDQPQNMIHKMANQDLNGFQWMNPPSQVRFSDEGITVSVGAETDFFNNPEDSAISASAPLLYRQITGDFVATTLVRPNFDDVWNACALMVHIDSLHWIKFAFENSDATGKSIVSVVTRGVSDDANGVMHNEQETIWLKMIRKGNLYAMHWSIDGKDFKMARLAAMPDSPSVKVGVEAQCPAGEGATHQIMYLSVEERTISNLRTLGQ